jgi:hypothetical protein
MTTIEPLTEREQNLIADCQQYSGSGLPGHAIMILVAKLSNNNRALEENNSLLAAELSRAVDLNGELERRLEAAQRPQEPAQELPQDIRLTDLVFGSIPEYWTASKRTPDRCNGCLEAGCNPLLCLQLQRERQSREGGS